MKAKIKIQIKKDTTQECTFNVNQSVPFPRISGWGQQWENDDGVLFGKYGNGPKGLANEYRIELLRSDLTEEKNTRDDYAGYSCYSGYDKPALPPNPGTIVFRGKDCGEMCFRMSANSGHWYAQGLDCPDVIHDQIRDRIGEYIENNAGELHAAAVEKLKANVTEAIRTAKKNVQEAEAIALEALKNF